MNTAALKTFAPAARRQLMEAVERKLDYVLTADTPDLRQAAPQVAVLRKEAEKGRDALVERVAYTWFNRLAALRFLDARGWHPFKARVLTPATPQETQPELLKLARTGSLPEELRPHTDPARLNDLLDGRLPTAIRGADPQGEVYRHLVLAACRFYHSLLPNLFEALDDETELLLPDDLLTAASVAEGFRTEISDDDCSEVEILGWLYQFYIAEKKDAVMARKKAVPTEDIPAVTQLFTPHWIVRYLVENSLGRLWLLNRPDSRLREHMPYYIEGEPETDFLKITKPEQISVCDPAAGSGHMLTYAFDLLTLIYEEEGYAPADIPALILRHNLHGLEICPRAAQLAELALVFKAREKSRRFFQPEHLVRPRILELRDVRFADNELREYIDALGLGDLFNQPMLKLLHQFEEAKNFGSLLQPCLDERAIAFARCAIEVKDLGGQLFLRETHLKVLRVLDQAEALTQRYHVVVANPPYMGTKQMGPLIKTFADSFFSDVKADLYAMFIDRSFSLAISSGYGALVTMQTWMFLSSFERFRIRVTREKVIISMAHLGPRGFNSINGEIVQTTAFVIKNIVEPQHRGSYMRLTDGRDEEEKAAHAINAISNQDNCRLFRSSSEAFNLIPGSPIAYWASDSLRKTFKMGRPMGEFAAPRQGMSTTNNGLFTRLWYEVSLDSIGFSYATEDQAAKSGRKWFPFNKGGTFRKWYGNRDYIVNWKERGRDIHKYLGLPLTYQGAPVRGKKHFFQEGATWTKISSSDLSVRVEPFGCIYSDAGMKVFRGDNTNGPSIQEVAGFLNSKVARSQLACLSETLNFEQGLIACLPAIRCASVSHVVELLVASAKADWDNFETSWDFRGQPLLRPGLKGATLEASWRNWDMHCTAAIRRMQELETENNRLFIAAYGLEGELQPEVPEEQITLARAEARRDIAAFLSYAVGCMMGRYSQDKPGLILSDAGDTLKEFVAKVGKPLKEIQFVPDADAIIPVLDGEWFEDDVVARTRQFLRVTFGDDAIEENLRFIEESLGKDLRKYFLTDFYRDHLQTYKKRPIYWLFQSPKKGFGALVYLHRYTRDTCNTLLNRYLRDYLKKLEARIKHLDHVQTSGGSAREKTVARKESDKLRKVLKECQEWEREVLLPLAQRRIELDLDDGVKINYQKFPGALAPIPGLADRCEEP